MPPIIFISLQPLLDGSILALIAKQWASLIKPEQVPPYFDRFRRSEFSGLVLHTLKFIKHRSNER